jgi:hypothetical protein
LRGSKEEMKGKNGVGRHHDQIKESKIDKNDDEEHTKLIMSDFRTLNIIFVICMSLEGNYYIWTGLNWSGSG